MIMQNIQNLIKKTKIAVLIPVVIMAIVMGGCESMKPDALKFQFPKTIKISDSPSHTDFILTRDLSAKEHDYFNGFFIEVYEYKGNIGKNMDTPFYKEIQNVLFVCLAEYNDPDEVKKEIEDHFDEAYSRKHFHFDINMRYAFIKAIRTNSDGHEELETWHYQQHPRYKNYYLISLHSIDQSVLSKGKRIPNQKVQTIQELYETEEGHANVTFDHKTQRFHNIHSSTAILLLNRLSHRLYAHIKPKKK
jgi:hypothetical protein